MAKVKVEHFATMENVESRGRDMDTRAATAERREHRKANGFHGNALLVVQLVTFNGSAQQVKVQEGSTIYKPPCRGDKSNYVEAWGEGNYRDGSSNSGNSNSCGITNDMQQTNAILDIMSVGQQKKVVLLKRAHRSGNRILITATNTKFAGLETEGVRGF